MNIAVASGKGGTGKTTVSIALAETLGDRAVLLDCDVEEPDCHLFLDGEISGETTVSVMIPQFHADKCTGCGRCTAACRFNTMASLGKKILIFQELCHSCGGCLLACPQGALSESSMDIGRIFQRDSGRFTLAAGELLVGHISAVPLIRALKKHADDKKINILDAPPGTSCSMVNTVRGCDYVILVTEPTPFGLHDLAGAVETLRRMDIKCGVIINRAGRENGIVEDFCRKNNLDVLMKIPLSRQIAEGYSSGKTLLQTVPELKTLFAEMLAGLGAV